MSESKFAILTKVDGKRYAVRPENIAFVCEREGLTRVCFGQVSIAVAEGFDQVMGALQKRGSKPSFSDLADQMTPESRSRAEAKASALRDQSANDHLLDALKGLLDFIDIDNLPMDKLALQIARDAVAKAEGNQL